MKIKFRKTEENDLDFVILNETREENKLYVNQWSREEHLKALKTESITHYIIEDKEKNEKIGYAILTTTPNNEIVEIKRIVIVEKNKGYGTHVLEKLKKIYFENYNTHRLWLDVRVNNERGKYLYQKLGFKLEGILRDAIYLNGKYESIMILSILDSEYKNTL